MQEKMMQGGSREAIVRICSGERKKKMPKLSPTNEPFFSSICPRAPFHPRPIFREIISDFFPHPRVFSVIFYRRDSNMETQYVIEMWYFPQPPFAFASFGKLPFWGGGIPTHRPLSEPTKPSKCHANGLSDTSFRLCRQIRRMFSLRSW